jgi:phage/plasmid-like protein (TIGR03299 family)
LQNRDAFKFFEPFIDSKEATIETAGSLREGNRVWIQAKISRDPMIIKGNDTVEKFLLLSNSHDGTLAVRVSLVGRRVVCANTLAMAHGEKSAKFIRIRHAKNVKDTLMGVQSIVNLVNNEFEATAEQYRRLANTQINSSDLEKYIKIVFDQSIKSKGVDFSTVGTVGGKILISQIIPLFEGGRGNNLPEIRNTWWSAYNAVNEHIGYNRGQNAEARLDSLWFGAGATLNKKALDVALQMAVA